MAHVHQINASDGGVPKLAVEQAVVGFEGLAEDRQADLRYHGGPDRALCLYSLEVIEALQAEGHPIAPGNAGENLTISGLDWPTLESGHRLRIGDVVAELTHPATPCSKNASWFVDRSFRRISDELHPGWSRWYARVIEPGVLTTGDSVELVARTYDSGH